MGVVTSLHPIQSEHASQMRTFISTPESWTSGRGSGGGQEADIAGPDL